MHARGILVCGAALAAAALGVSTEPIAARQAPAAWNGVYSEAQAKRGATLYAANCVQCHGKDLAGGDRAPAAAGPSLVARWGSRPVGDLFEYVHAAMPLTRPGGLTRRQNADIVAYMLQRSGVPGGATEYVPANAGPADPPTVAPSYPVATKVAARHDAYYTAEQAERGKAAFNRNCAFCHGTNPAASTDEDLVQAMPSTFAGRFLSRVVNGKHVYPNVYVLFSKFQSMPAFNTRAVSDQARADIAAYVLQLNGYPAGRTEVPVDAGAMQLMNLNEKDFEPVFNGRDFSGMRFTIPSGCTENTPGQCGPAPHLRIENGVLACECNVHGYWFTEKRYKDFTLRFDYRFERPAEWAGDEELFSGGGGYLLLAQMGSPGYPRSIEIEGRHRDLLEVFAIGGQADWSFDVEARRRAIRPLGEWNAIELVAKDGQLRGYLNGTLVTTIRSHNYTEPGNIAFQVQGARMYWRNIRIRPE